MTHFLWKNIIKYKLIKKITHPVVKVSKKRLKLLKKYPKGFVISKKNFPQRNAKNSMQELIFLIKRNFPSRYLLVHFSRINEKRNKNL